ncbi:MAG TPA: hypothetical protein VE282_00545, partial [Gemmatimonadales bacterium]|nr:hypothetical protein [Gemmatimonadales bacterium]
IGPSCANVCFDMVVGYIILLARPPREPRAIRLTPLKARHRLPDRLACTTLEESVAQNPIMLTPMNELAARNTLCRTSRDHERERGHS